MKASHGNAAALGAPSLETEPKHSGPAKRFTLPSASLSKLTLPNLNLPVFKGQQSEAPAPLLNSIAPLKHRENTPLHALRDTLAANTPSVHLKKAAEVDALANLEGTVVLLGGYRGSVLRDSKTNRRLWAPVKAALRLRTADLTLGLHDEDELRSAETVTAEKVLTTVGGFVQMGKNLKDKLIALEKESKIRFKSFGYDWRRNLDLSSAELLHFLEESYADTGRGATVIAHSMGGLVTLHALATASNPRVFARIVLAGVPFQGCANALGPLRHGDALGFNAQICAPRAVFSMRSTFYFLPITEDHIFEKEDGEPIETDFFSVRAWSHYGFSPVALDLHNPASATRELALRDAETASFLDPESASILEQRTSDDHDYEQDFVQGDESDMPGPEPGSLPIAPSISAASLPRSTVVTEVPPLDLDLSKVPSARDDALIADYLHRTLHRVQTFRKEILDGYDGSKIDAYPPIGLLVSASTPTVRGARVASEADVIAGDFSKLLYDYGDGIVLHSSAVNLPGHWGHLVKAVENSTYGHVSLLSDLSALRRCLAAL